MKSRSVLLLSFLVVGCQTTTTITKDNHGGDAGPSPSDPEPTTSTAGAASGTRLKARWTTAEDGAKQFRGFWDSARETECSFQGASDGTTRCLPSGMFIHPTFFADAACTKRIAYGEKGCAAKTATLQGRYCAGSEITQTIFTLGARFTAPQLYNKDGASCTSISAASWADRDLYVVGAEIPPSEFVAAKTEIE